MYTSMCYDYIKLMYAGLFKDFWTDLSHRVFDVNFGLFIETSDKMTFPNPSATRLYDDYEIDNLYLFLGRVLGKALFENIVVQPQFAHFFLAFMHGRYNFMNLINDLSTLDKELYKNLMFLKTYDDDITALDLFFSVTDDSFGNIYIYMYICIYSFLFSVYL